MEMTDSTRFRDDYRRRTSPLHRASGHHSLVVHRRFGGSDHRSRAGSGLPYGRVGRSNGSGPRCPRSAGDTGSRHRLRAGSHREFHEYSATAPRRITVASALRSSPVLHFRVLEGSATSRFAGSTYSRSREGTTSGAVRGRDHARVTTPAEMGPPACAGRVEYVGWSARPRHIL